MCLDLSVCLSVRMSESGCAFLGSSKCEEKDREGRQSEDDLGF